VTPQRSAADYLAEIRPELGGVPHVSEEGVCDRCLGPVGMGFTHCAPCHKLFAQAPHGLRLQVVPVTAAPDPGPWYSRLVRYKTTSTGEWVYLAALAAVYYKEQQDRIAAALGGEPSVITVVPSKRGRPFETQPLRVAMDRVAALRPRLRKIMEHVANREVARQSYVPDAFRVIAPIDHERILLIEDTWTTGATAISAAGALHNAGARSVLVLPLARKINVDFWSDDHPYLIAMRRGWNPSSWPRG
jgi:predicted amidophosphoribosyltransferase